MTHSDHKRDEKVYETKVEPRAAGLYQSHHEASFIHTGESSHVGRAK